MPIGHVWDEEPQKVRPSDLTKNTRETSVDIDSETAEVA